jgi:ATP-dependent helicase HrpB
MTRVNLNPPLPIDPLLPRLLEALRERGQAVLCAPPGSGKTTRVPPAILASGLAGEGEVLVLEPRRIAARLSARRVAGEMGEAPGGTVGYQVRYEDVSGPRTRIRFVTEGILSRRLLSDPHLSGVSAVLLDEFHERHVHSDLALAWVRRLRATSRPDLLVVVMSATLDAERVASFLGAPVLAGEGRVHPVAVEHLPPSEEGRGVVRLEDRVRRAVRRLFQEEPRGGDVLVFLPGWGEIRRCAELLAPALPADAELLPLHGDLSPEEQDRAVAPSEKRKVILATNVAETSVTIPGVTAVVDSGLARVASHSPWSGIARLALSRISRASAEQRAGRAGRTAPGRALRLYTERDCLCRPPFDAPEAVRGDASEPLLLLAALGAPDLPWLDPPPAASLAAARALLSRLGAVDGEGAVTERGRAMLRFPLHPRLSRLLVEASVRGVPALGACAAALLSEGDPRERRRDGREEHAPTGASDLLWLSHLLEEGAKGSFTPSACRRLGLSPAQPLAAWRTRDRLLRLALPTGAKIPAAGEEGEGAEEALLLAVLAAFPDRVGRRRAPGSPEVVLSGGGSARLDPGSAVREASLLAAVEVEERREGGSGAGSGAPAAGGAVIRLASAVTAEMLLSLFPESLRFEEEFSWHREGERVEAKERLLYDGFTLEEARKGRPDPERAAEILFAEACRTGGLAAFAQEGEAARLLARVELVARNCPEAGVAPPSPESLRGVLRRLCEGRRSFAELREAPVLEAIASLLPPSGRSALARLAPERVDLPGGRSAKVVYGEEGGARVEARMADFFGAAAGPSICGGRVPLVLHLLAPNHRPVQVTTDLSGFWSRHYPTIRKELSRKYPRHPWPEDPTVPPPKGAGRR